MKKLIWKHRKLVFWTGYINLLTTCAVYFGLLILIYLIYSVFGNWFSVLLKDDFIAGFILSVIASVFAYITYFIQTKKTKRESTTKEYYEEIIIPLYLELKKQKELIVKGHFLKINNELIKVIPEISFEFYIPEYLHNELNGFSSELKTIKDSNSCVNQLFYDNAFPLKENNDVGIKNATNYDFFERFLTDKKTVFIYTDRNHNEINNEKQCELNQIMIRKLEKEELFISIMGNYNNLIKIIENLEQYYQYIIKKSIKQLI